MKPEVISVCYLNKMTSSDGDMTTIEKKKRRKRRKENNLYSLVVNKCWQTTKKIWKTTILSMFGKYSCIERLTARLKGKFPVVCDSH